MQNSSPPSFRSVPVGPVAEPMPAVAIVAGVFGIVSALPLAYWFGLSALVDDLSAPGHLVGPIALLEFLAAVVLLCGVSWLPLLFGSLLATLAGGVLGIASAPEGMGMAWACGMALCPSIATLFVATPPVHRWIASRSHHPS